MSLRDRRHQQPRSRGCANVRSNIPLLITPLRPLRGRKTIATATCPLHYSSATLSDQVTPIQGQRYSFSVPGYASVPRYAPLHGGIHLLTKTLGAAQSWYISRLQRIFRSHSCSSVTIRGLPPFSSPFFCLFRVGNVGPVQTEPFIRGLKSDASCGTMRTAGGLVTTRCTHGGHPRKALG